jgi:hypothetical protein
VTNKEGVPVGKHRVVIEGYEPQKYNKQSDMTVEVPAGESQVVRNFELKP